jgi:hypothetical protein
LYANILCTSQSKMSCSLCGSCSLQATIFAFHVS